MSQADSQRRVLNAMTDTSTLSPEGAASVQIQGGTAYVALPSRLVDFYGIEQSTELERAFDPASSCLVIPLQEGVSLFE